MCNCHTPSKLTRRQALMGSVAVGATLTSNPANAQGESPLVCRRLVTSCHATISNVYNFA